MAASRDRVWRDFTDSTAVAEWIWPTRFATTAVTEPVPMGAWEVRSDVVGIAVIGRVLAIDAPRQLRLAWRWDGDEHTSDVEITLKPAADGATRVSVRHTGFQTAQEREEHVEGWSDCLQRLVERYSSPPR
ncbi:SRPBCC family protein [uncultured Microbacterium sp.]|uniref:SRPBCC family protein n=1 Tax=uncultured Microbacterium sp. TaxID=191216 RepID=UPI0028D7DB14|nr:SRPBCC family protein [uncultured Microbacterium sp.]